MPGKTLGEYIVEEMVLMGDYKRVFQSTKGVLQDHGYEIKIADSDKGILQGRSTRTVSYWKRFLIASFTLAKRGLRSTYRYKDYIVAKISPEKEKRIRIGITLQRKYYNIHNHVLQKKSSRSSKKVDKILSDIQKALFLEMRALEESRLDKKIFTNRNF